MPELPVACALTTLRLVPLAVLLGLRRDVEREERELDRQRKGSEVVASGEVAGKSNQSLESFELGDVSAPYPHCDSRVLHRPGLCEYCDRYPQRQVDRIRAGINFSGEHKPGLAPCPADAAVANGERGDYNRWGGNTPEGYTTLLTNVTRDSLNTATGPLFMDLVFPTVPVTRASSTFFTYPLDDAGWSVSFTPQPVGVRTKLRLAIQSLVRWVGQRVNLPEFADDDDADAWWD